MVPDILDGIRMLANGTSSHGDQPVHPVRLARACGASVIAGVVREIIRKP